MRAKKVYEPWLPKTKDELLAMPTEELKQYLKDAREEVKRLKAETAKFNKQAEEDRLKNAEMRGELKGLEQLNQYHKKRLGWTELTDAELKWLADGGWAEHFSANYFRPDQRQIKAKYAEVMKKDVDDSIDKKFKDNPKMENPSGWIDRKGRYHPVGFAEHNEFARKFIVHAYGKEKAEELRGAGGGFKKEYYEIMEKNLQWVRIMAWPGVKTNFSIPKNLSHAQKQTLYKYCEIHNEPLPFEDDLFDE